MYRNVLVASLTLAIVAVLAGTSLADNQSKKKDPVPKSSQPPAPKKARAEIKTPNSGTPPVVTVPTTNTGRPPLKLPLDATNQRLANQPLGQAGVAGSTSSGAASPVPRDVFSIATPTAMVAGNSIAVSVKAVIQNGNLDTSYSGPVTLTSSDGQLKPVTINLSKGQGAANIVLTKVNKITLSAKAGSVSGQSNQIQVNPGVAKSLKIIAPSTLHAKSNTFNQIDLIALDAFGNVANANGDAMLQSSAPGVVANPNPVPMQSGKGVFFCEFTQAESVTLTVSFLGLVARQTINVLP